MDLGATEWATFRKVTLPMIAPGVGAAALLAGAISIDDYVITSFNAGQTQTFPLFIFGATRQGVPPEVNVLATGLLVIVLILMGAQRGRAAAPGGARRGPHARGRLARRLADGLTSVASGARARPGVPGVPAPFGAATRRTNVHGVQVAGARADELARCRIALAGPSPRCCARSPPRLPCSSPCSGARSGHARPGRALRGGGGRGRDRRGRGRRADARRTARARRPGDAARHRVLHDDGPAGRARAADARRARRRERDDRVRRRARHPGRHRDARAHRAAGAPAHTTCAAAPRAPARAALGVVVAGRRRPRVPHPRAQGPAGGLRRRLRPAGRGLLFCAMLSTARRGPSGSRGAPPTCWSPSAACGSASRSSPSW